MKRPPLPRFEDDLHFDRRRAVRGRKIGGFDADEDPALLGFDWIHFDRRRDEPGAVGRGRANECAGETGPRLADLGPDHSPSGELPIREDPDLEHLIICADRQGCCVHIGNTVSVVIVDIGDKDVRLRTVLPGIIFPRQRIGTSNGGYHSCDTEGWKDVLDR